MFQVKAHQSEACQLSSKLSYAETRLSESERQREALAGLQSQKWREFSRMADSMKELSHNMLEQSQNNTKKAAIRSDLDEELDY